MLAVLPPPVMTRLSPGVGDAVSEMVLSLVALKLAAVVVAKARGSNLSRSSAKSPAETRQGAMLY